MTSAKGVGMPIKLLHESEGHIITVRLLALLVSCLYISHRRDPDARPVGVLKAGTSTPSKGV
jgi:hypothetical protein